MWGMTRSLQGVVRDQLLLETRNLSRCMLLMRACMAYTNASNANPPPHATVAIALGTNMGDRLANVHAALQALEQRGVHVRRHSRLYQTAPAYVTDQPRFLNAAVTAATHAPPLELLRTLKDVEASLGRDFHGQRYGPRPIDLDIIFYRDMDLDDPALRVPHPRWRERSFVKAPLADLAGPLVGAAATDPGLAAMLDTAAGVWEAEGGEAQVGGDDIRAVIPLPNHRSSSTGGRMWAWQQRSWVMGVLNLTPDSFSDGGQHSDTAAALEQARLMVAEGVDIIDVGGQSTRPNATRLTAEQELGRVLPVLRAVQQDEVFRDTMVSVDTFYGLVAREAVAAGAHIVNDVSGGTLDPEMLPQVAELGVPLVLMHMRGDPSTMQSPANTAYRDVCRDVAAELRQRAEAAMRAGIEPWRLILDPGIGFAKTGEGNLRLMGGLREVRRQLAAEGGVLGRLPLLVGPSRKGFLGRITGRTIPSDRDAATAAAAALCVANGANIVRAHNVGAVRDAVRVADAVAEAMASSSSLE